MMIFVPLTSDEARTLRSSGLPGTRVAYAGTPTLRRSHEYDDSMTEDADFAAMSYAGVHALTAPGEAARLVVALEVPDERVDDGRDPYGQVSVTDLGWREVTALFGDEPGSEQAVTDARLLVTGLDVAAALSHEVIGSLLDDHDLLWYAPEELDRLL